MSYPLTISGFITQILPIEIKEDSDYSHNFYLQRIHISASGQEYVIDFLKEKIKLLEKCMVGDEVEIDLTLIARSWLNRFNEKTIYNVLKAQKLKIISSEFDMTIMYDEIAWKLYQEINLKGYINLILLNISNGNKLYLTNIQNETEDLKSVFFLNSDYENTLIKTLEEFNVIQLGQKLNLPNGIPVYACKLKDNYRIKVL